MMAENIQSFIEGLIEKTKEGELDWRPLSLNKYWKDIESELENEKVAIDFGVNSIRISNSYYLKSGEGFVFLFEIFHGNPEVTSPEFDTVALMVKINDALTIDNLTNFSEYEQEQLRTLQLLIADYYSTKYSYPDVLYRFFSQVIEDK